MSKLRLAKEIADATGTSLSRAKRFVDDVGAPAAKRSVQTAKKQPWYIPATAGVVGGSGIYLREQELRELEMQTERTETESEGIATLIESNLDPETKRRLLEAWLGAEPANEGIVESVRSWFDELDVVGEAEKTVVLIVVVAVVLLYVLGQTQQAAVYGGGR